jgi:hypothetical protein
MTSAHLSTLPAPGAYARALRTLRGLPLDTPIKHTDWTRGTVTVEQWRAEFRLALDRRINIRGGHPEWNEPISIDLKRDAWALNARKATRVRVYQLNHFRMQRRFAHLLSRWDD